MPVDKLRWNAVKYSTNQRRQEKRETEEQKPRDKQKTNNKIIGVNPVSSIITLKVNDLALASLPSWLYCSSMH